MNDKAFPARLHALVARDKKTALVIRRGPSKHTCVLLWDIRTDEFTVSQWLKGRIYERRSDISPDGKYWGYFAMNGRWDSEIKGSWTAVARTPWLKAVTLFAKGDCWHGGGLFVGNSSFWLNEETAHPPREVHELLETTGEIEIVREPEGMEYFGGECTTIYYNRLQRSGWRLIEHKIINDHHEQTIFKKQLSPDWVLEKICHEQLNAPKGKGCYWDEHALNLRSGKVMQFPNWEWAEWVDEAIVFAREGHLYRLKIDDSKVLQTEILVHDFNSYTFEERKAPY